MFSRAGFDILTGVKSAPEGANNETKTGEWKLRMLRRLTGIMIAVLCVCAAFACAAEIKAENTENNGKLSQTVWRDENGDLAVGPEGYTKVKYSYKGGDTFEMYFDRNGAPCQSTEGCFGRRISREKGKITQIEYLDQDGKRMLNRKEYGMMTISYYGFGEIRMVSYYGMGKKSVMVPSLGYAKVYNEYSYKTMTMRQFQDVNGDPVDNAQGYATVKQKLDKKSRVMSIRYDNAKGKPAIGPDGWFRCKFERDEDGRITKIEYQDTDEKLTDRGAGYAWEEREYEGETVLVTRYDLSGNKVTDKDGIATYARKMDEDDRIKEERFRDESGKAAVNSLGAGGIRYTYDHDGRIETVTYLDTEGKVAVCNKGYAGYRDTRDEDGATVTRTFLGTDGVPVEISGGYSEIRYFYDDTKVLTGTRYYDINGTQVKAD